MELLLIGALIIGISVLGLVFLWGAFIAVDC